MQHFLNMIVFSFLFLFLFLFSLQPASAGVDLPWSTTYDCAEWEYGESLDCDGLDSHGADQQCGYGERITSAANYSSGGGGRGQRHLVASGDDQNTGGLKISFNQSQTEIWIRWYMRYESGFGWSSSPGGVSPGYDKWLYFRPAEAHPNWKDTHVVVEGMSGNKLSADNKGWAYIMGGDLGSGEWHCYEVHLKSHASDAAAQVWIDEELIVDYTGFACTKSPWTSIVIGSNQNPASHSGCEAVDFDDIAISNTGYIGPIPGGSDTIPPSVSISSPTPGQTVSGILAISASASDNVGVAGVQFKIDGNDVGAEDTTSPYSIFQDTTVFLDGSHTVTATARDAAGNQATSSPVSITISNGGGGGGEILFEETFEDAAFDTRGWYDNINLQLSTTEHIAGSTSSAEFHFVQGATKPTSGGAIRKKFSETEQIYVSFFIKHSSSWTGSNKSYHPHEFYILTNLDGDWTGPAYSHLTAYIEENEGEPLISIQDGKNIDESNIGVNLTNVTEQRSVAGCNGDSDGHGNGECYSVGSVHYNGKEWRAGSIYFQHVLGLYYKNDWHFIEAYIKLNSISGGKGLADGVIQYWYDGNLIIDHSDVVLRTGQYPDMKFNQFIIAPWIGDGSPVDQTFWIDELTVATAGFGVPPSPPPWFTK
jgi:hypothetical protein